jgi:uncharacterized protein YyaL (SSP411 family)
MQRFVRAMALVTCCALGATMHAAPAPAPAAIVWHAWSDDLFVQARVQKRFVLLDLEAIWCHWCHVMDQTTYQDHDVTRLIGEQYLAVRVDQDADPALSVRYQDYGWPATIVLAADGSEIVKRRGYLSPTAMASMLAAIIKDPAPGPSIIARQAVQPAHSAILGAAARQALVATYFESYDTQYAGWGTVQKFIDADSLEYALAHANSDAKQAAMARNTLNAALALIDPVWGGVYQYSDERDWKSPHFEKIMSFQTQYMRLYAEGYRLLGDPTYLKAAQNIDRYVENFLTSPEGVVYTSQDADVDAEHTGHVFYAMSDIERRRQPNPQIDRHVYARENGWAIAAWAALYDATGDARYVSRAQRAAAWIGAHRGLGDGGFSHGEHTGAPAALGDSIAMGQGFLCLYAATGERAWLFKARQAAQFIGVHFAAPDGGYLTVATSAGAQGVFKEAVRDVDENIAVARFANSLYHYSGAVAFRNIAQHALRYLAAPQLADGRHLRTGILLADAELGSAPTHVTIVGHKNDASAQSLQHAALRYPSIYRRVDWWDKREGAMPNPDVSYPELARAAAFICTGNTCSQPVFDPLQLAQSIDLSMSAE